MNTYSLYVGSTDTHDAHCPNDTYDGLIWSLFPEGDHTQNVRTYGVWNGVTEHTAIYTVGLADDATAQRVAYAIAVLTSNDAVLVVRDAVPSDDAYSLNSTRRYRASRRAWLTTGNRTLYSAPSSDYVGVGYIYESDVLGPEIVFLVGLDATVSPL